MPNSKKTETQKTTTSTKSAKKKDKQQQQMILRMTRGQEDSYFKNQIGFKLNFVLDVSDESIELINKYQIGDVVLIPRVRAESLEDEREAMAKAEQDYQQEMALYEQRKDEHKQQLEKAKEDLKLKKKQVLIGASVAGFVLGLLFGGGIMVALVFAFLALAGIYFFILPRLKEKEVLFNEDKPSKQDFASYVDLKITDLIQEGGKSFITPHIWELLDYESVAKKSFLRLNSYLNMLANFGGEETLNWKKIKEEIESEEYQEEQKMLEEFKTKEKEDHL